MCDGARGFRGTSRKRVGVSMLVRNGFGECWRAAAQFSHQHPLMVLPFSPHQLTGFAVPPPVTAIKAMAAKASTPLATPAAPTPPPAAAASSAAPVSVAATPAGAAIPRAPMRTAAQVLASRRSSVVGGIELDLETNLNERLLDNRPKRERKPVAIMSSYEPEPLRRTMSKTKLGPQLRYCSAMLRDFIQSKKLVAMTWPFLEPVDPVVRGSFPFPPGTCACARAWVCCLVFSWRWLSQSTRVCWCM